MIVRFWFKRIAEYAMMSSITVANAVKKPSPTNLKNLFREIVLIFLISLVVFLLPSFFSIFSFGL